MRKLKQLAAVMLTVSMILVSARAAEDKTPASSDKDRLQGTWKVVKKVKNGTAEEVDANPASITFAGDTVTSLTGKGDKGEGTFTLGESKSPKWITLTGTSGEHAGSTFAAIYELNGDTLKLAYSTGKNYASRPEDFAGDQGHALEVLERVKP